MKKLLLLSSTIAMLSSFTFGEQQGEKVYICTGGKAQCYHSRSNCSGLSRCSREIKEISLEDAKKMNKRPCKVCCPQ